jgi:hypothetical protein
MKLVTWNCNGALRKKLKEVDSLGGDLLLIQECENPVFSTKHYREWAGNYLWLGSDKKQRYWCFPEKWHLCFGLKLERQVRDRWIQSVALRALMVYIRPKAFPPFQGK